MSKRGAGANWGDGQERYGGSGPEMDGTADKPMQATAAQMARRKIAQGRKGVGGRARSGSPAVLPSQAGFAQAGTASQAQQQPNDPTPFQQSGFNFAFGAQNQPQQNGASTPTFQFGATPAPTQPQQNGTSNIFNNQAPAPSFGSSFNSGASQPQQNGFTQSSQPTFPLGLSQPSQPNGTSTPSTSFGGGFGSGFGSQTQKNSSSGGFNMGGTSQEQPSTGFSFAQQPNETNARPNPTFGGLNQNQSEDEAKSSNSLSGFGQQQWPQENGNKPSSTFRFGQQNGRENGANGQQKAAANEQPSGVFSGFGQKAQDIANKPASPFPSLGQTSSTPGQASNPFAAFGQKPVEDSSKSSSVAPSQPRQETPKPAANPFGNTLSTQASTPSTVLGTGLFGSKPFSTTPANGTASIFAGLPKQDLSNGGKPLFGSSIPGQVYKEGDDDDENADIEASESLSQQAASTNKATNTNIFGGLSQSQPGQAKAATNVFGQAQGGTLSQQDTSMTTPTATPSKPLFPPSATAVSDTPSTQPPRSLFDRIDPAETARKMVQKPDETPSASWLSATPAPSAIKKSLFSQPASNSFAGASASSIFQNQQGSSLFESQTPKAAPPAKDLFSKPSASPSSGASPPPPASVAPAAPPAPTPAISVAPSGMVAPKSGPSTATVAAAAVLSAEQRDAFKDLNDSLIAHLKCQDADKDWSSIYRYCLLRSAEIAGRSAPSDNELNPVSKQASERSDASNTSTSTSAAPQSSAPPTLSGLSGNFFAQTPKAATSTLLFNKPPATAPPTRKRLFEEDDDEPAQGPATDKRSKPNESAQYPRLPPSASNTAKLFASTLADPNPTGAVQPASKPLFPSSSATTGAPKLTGFTPTITTSTTSSGGFLSSFGNLAKKTEEQERQKRKDEDYDSDDETEEQWEKRDREEREKKRKEIEEAAKGAKGFSFSVASPAKTSSTAKPPTAATVEKALGTGDKTWNPETPIKFNPFASISNATSSTTPAAAAPKFGSMFAGISTPANATSSLAPPASGNIFGSKTSSLNVSRATTPGITTDGEASTGGDKDNDDSETQQDPQSNDNTGLLPQEREDNDVLAEFDHFKAQKYEADKEGNKKWTDRASGKVYLLKSKTTGKTRILSRVGTGILALNYEALKGVKYAVHPKKDVVVMGQFYDHLHANPPDMATWLLRTANASDAKELARILAEGAE